MQTNQNVFVHRVKHINIWGGCTVILCSLNLKAPENTKAADLRNKLQPNKNNPVISSCGAKETRLCAPSITRGVTMVRE